MRNNAVIQAFLAAGLIASAPFASAASNLVFCSEGSPAGFDPSQAVTFYAEDDQQYAEDEQL